MWNLIRTLLDLSLLTSTTPGNPSLAELGWALEVLSSILLSAQEHFIPFPSGSLRNWVMDVTFLLSLLIPVAKECYTYFTVLIYIALVGPVFLPPCWDLKENIQSMTKDERNWQPAYNACIIPNRSKTWFLNQLFFLFLFFFISISRMILFILASCVLKLFGNFYFLDLYTLLRSWYPSLHKIHRWLIFHTCSDFNSKAKQFYLYDILSSIG